MHQISIAMFVVLWFFVPSTSAQDAAKHDGFFVFLVTGKSTAGVAASEVATMQAAHLGNFGTLASKGQLLTAGPCSDPSKTTRGIVVLNGQTREQVEAMFVADPYIKKGFMKLDIVEQRVIAGKLQTKLDPAGLEQDLLVIFERTEALKDASNEQREQAGAEHRAWVTQQFAADKIGYASEFSQDVQRLGIAILRSSDSDAAAVMLARHPLTTQRLITYKCFSQYLTKGTLAPRNADGK